MQASAAPPARWTITVTVLHRNGLRDLAWPRPTWPWHRGRWQRGQGMVLFIRAREGTLPRQGSHREEKLWTG
jgi:hypothetical protein